MMRCGLLGRTLSHSLSPQIHRFFGDYSYELFSTEPEALEQFLRTGAFDAINVTIPYKKDVIPYCRELSDAAKKIGSVNTLRRRADGTLFGDNTDYYGFRWMLESRGFAVAGKKCLVLGSGGASLAVCTVLRDMQAREVVVISRSGENNYSNISLHYDADAIVNTTPVGMYPHNGESPLGLEGFSHLNWVVDIIYNPVKTAFLLDAESLGIPCENGLPMLVAQAKRASEVFTGGILEDALIEEVTDHILSGMKNIVLIGMPGSGKSTVAKLLADRLNRPITDTDYLVEEKAGISIPDLIAQKGENFFRDLETVAVKEAGMQTGWIIATGGGAILREENRRALRQNGTVIFLDRPMEQLDVKGRPLSDGGRALERLSRERMPIYRSMADHSVAVSEDPEQTLERILAFLQNKQ
ncbi:MAG: shikimate kinase [Oscillospiraceae bacterium]|nr:shikimate kinase [Oscillospiraceae bacterium]